MLTNPPWQARLAAFVTMWLALGALGPWGTVGFLGVGALGLLVALGLWYRASDSPEGFVPFAAKVTAIVAIAALAIWLGVMLLDVVEPFWLGATLTAIYFVGFAFAAWRLAIWEHRRSAESARAD